MPEEKEQDDDRNRNAEKPEKNAASHKSSPLLLQGQRRRVSPVPARRRDWSVSASGANASMD
jgi:hypothetical protein